MLRILLEHWRVNESTAAAAGGMTLLLILMIALTGCDSALQLTLPTYEQQGISLMEGSHPNAAGEADPNRIKSDAQREIQERFGVFVTNNAADIPPVFWYPLAARGMSNPRFIVFTERLLTEFEFYSADFVRSADLDYVFVADQLTSNGTYIGGLANYNGIICVVSAQVFHHELFHMADEADGGAGSNNYVFPWSERDDEASGQDVLGTTTSSSMLMKWLELGYVNEYAARSNANEDQAIFFELCITSRFDIDLFRITDISPDDYGEQAKTYALDKLLKMSLAEEVSPLVYWKIQDTLAFYERLS